jgi:hypothetical protein
VKHHHPRRQRHDDFHDVLDNHQGNAGTMDVAHEIDRELHLALRQARHRFIEQQHLRLGRQCAGDFEPLAAGRAERSCRRFGELAHADARQDSPRACFGLGAVRGAQERTDHHILQHRHALECLRHLEGAGETEMRARLRRQIGDVLTLEQNLAGGRGEIAGQAIEQRGFAGPVRPNQAENVALRQRHRGRIDRLEAAKGLCHIAGFKEHGPLPLRPSPPAVCPVSPTAA